MIEQIRLFTNERYSETRHFTEPLAEQLVKAIMQGRFRETVVIVPGCTTLHLDDMTKAVIQNGASTYLF